jgi:hypothetical protein
MAEEITTVLEEEQLETDQSVVTDEATDEVLEADTAEVATAEAEDDLSDVDTEKGYKKKQFPPNAGGNGGNGGNGNGGNGEGGGEGGGKPNGKPPKCGPNQVYDEKSEKCVASKETEELSILASFLAEETAKGISAQLTPVFESFTESLKVMGNGMEAIAAKMVVAEDTETETKPEAEPEPETVESVKQLDPMQSVASVLTNLQAQLVETQKQVSDVTKTADAISQSTPDPIDREETVKAAEAEGQPNDCFDNIWPFLGQ